jgi:hypothetical protein
MQIRRVPKFLLLQPSRRCPSHIWQATSPLKRIILLGRLKSIEPIWQRRATSKSWKNLLLKKRGNLIILQWKFRLKWGKCLFSNRWPKFFRGIALRIGQ